LTSAHGPPSLCYSTTFRSAFGQIDGPTAQTNLERDLTEAMVEGAALRVRAIAMTVAVIIAGLLPVM
jgi:Cu/Ag efflux pump CusA